VQIARDALGIARRDARPLTVTGGLPYFGGPGNNYVGHSIAAMTRRLRENRGDIGVVTANGWYVTKHSIGVYSAAPPRRPWVREDPYVAQREVDAQPHPDYVEQPSGEATAETYTVSFDRDGQPESSIVIARTADGKRCIANTPADRSLLTSMVEREFIGTRGRVAQGEDGRNVFSPA
jgi:acetyl-CoA C-acetyltransferase